MVWSHFTVAFGLLPYQDFLTYTPVHIFWDGYAAVAMFFVLSGMVLSIKHFSPPVSQALSMDLPGFYVTRIFRILLPFAAIVFVSFVFQRGVYSRVVTDPNASAWLYGFWISPEPLREAALLIPPPRFRPAGARWST